MHSCETIKNRSDRPVQFNKQDIPVKQDVGMVCLGCKLPHLTVSQLHFATVTEEHEGLTAVSDTYVTSLFKISSNYYGPK